MTDMENERVRLLIVEDEEAFRELLVRRFNQGEFEVTGCASGEEALKKSGPALSTWACSTSACPEFPGSTCCGR